MKLRLLCALALIAIPTVAMANETTVERFSYACANNEVLHGVYVNGADGKSFAISQQVDEMIPMARDVSASGAIYKAISPDYGYTLLTKGKEASLEDAEGTILTDCQM